MNEIVLFPDIIDILHYLTPIYTWNIAVLSFIEFVCIMQIGNQNKTLVSVVQAEVEDTKRVINIRQSKKDRQYNG